MAFRLLNGGNALTHPLLEMFVVVNFMGSRVLLPGGCFNEGIAPGIFRKDLTQICCPNRTLTYISGLGFG